MCAKLFKDGFAPFCPWHDRTYVSDNPDAEFSVAMFYNYSMAWLEVSDAVFLLQGWGSSKGTLAEVKRAKELGIPIFEEYKDILEFKSQIKPKNTL